jgi:general secretion pathway protein D
LIVELSAADAAQIGVQWQNISGTSNNAVYSGTNFNAGVGTGANVVNLSSSTNAILSGGGTATSATVAPAAGLNLGLIKSFVGGTGISALVNALESRAGTNILSTPNLMTLDNEEARIVVGQNVPIITGQFSQGTVSSTGVNPFQTVARQDIGVTLRVKPQISETGTIKLQIYQEVSSINTSLSTTTGGYVLNKRNIESNVLVDDGQMLVLGGLMQDSYTDSAFKVPYLSNIPYLGALFRSDAKTREKSNLMVFLRPKIVKDENELKNLSDSSFDSMNQRRENFEQAPKLVPKEKLPTMDEFSTIQTPSSKESSPAAVPFAVK